MAEHSVTAEGPAAVQWGWGRITVEVVTIAVLIVPLAWLVLHWPRIPAASPHSHHGRMSLWIMPAYMVALYLVLSEFGLLSKMPILKRGHRLSGLKRFFVAYFLAARVELLAFLAVLSLAMDQTAVTGRVWGAKSFIAASLTVVALTILLFTFVIARAGYRDIQAPDGWRGYWHPKA